MDPDSQPPEPSIYHARNPRRMGHGMMIWNARHTPSVGPSLGVGAQPATGPSAGNLSGLRDCLTGFPNRGECNLRGFRPPCILSAHAASAARCRSWRFGIIGDRRPYSRHAPSGWSLGRNRPTGRGEPPGLKWSGYPAILRTSPKVPEAAHLPSESPNAESRSVSHGREPS